MVSGVDRRVFVSESPAAGAAPAAGVQLSPRARCYMQGREVEEWHSRVTSDVSGLPPAPSRQRPPPFPVTGFTAACASPCPPTVLREDPLSVIHKRVKTRRDPTLTYAVLVPPRLEPDRLLPPCQRFSISQTNRRPSRARRLDGASAPASAWGSRDPRVDLSTVDHVGRHVELLSTAAHTGWQSHGSSQADSRGGRDDAPLAQTRALQLRPLTSLYPPAAEVWAAWRAKRCSRSTAAVAPIPSLPVDRTEAARAFEAPLGGRAVVAGWEPEQTRSGDSLLHSVLSAPPSVAVRATLETAEADAGGGAAGLFLHRQARAGAPADRESLCEGFESPSLPYQPSAVQSHEANARTLPFPWKEASRLRDQALRHDERPLREGQAGASAPGGVFTLRGRPSRPAAETRGRSAESGLASASSYASSRRSVQGHAQACALHPSRGVRGRNQEDVSMVFCTTNGLSSSSSLPSPSSHLLYPAEAASAQGAATAALPSAASPLRPASRLQSERPHSLSPANPGGSAAGDGGFASSSARPRPPSAALPRGATPLLESEAARRAERTWQRHKRLALLERSHARDARALEPSRASADVWRPSLEELAPVAPEGRHTADDTTVDSAPGASAPFGCESPRRATVEHGGQPGFPFLLRRESREAATSAQRGDARGDAGAGDRRSAAGRGVNRLGAGACQRLPPGSCEEPERAESFEKTWNRRGGGQWDSSAETRESAAKKAFGDVHSGGSRGPADAEDKNPFNTFRTAFSSSSPSSSSRAESSFLGSSSRGEDRQPAPGSPLLWPPPCGRGEAPAPPRARPPRRRSSPPLAASHASAPSPSLPWAPAGEASASASSGESSGETPRVAGRRSSVDMECLSPRRALARARRRRAEENEARARAHAGHLRGLVTSELQELQQLELQARLACQRLHEQAEEDYGRLVSLRQRSELLRRELARWTACLSASRAAATDASVASSLESAKDGTGRRRAEGDARDADRERTLELQKLELEVDYLERLFALLTTFHAPQRGGPEDAEKREASDAFWGDDEASEACADRQSRVVALIEAGCCAGLLGEDAACSGPPETCEREPVRRRRPACTRHAEERLHWALGSGGQLERSRGDSPAQPCAAPPHAQLRAGSCPRRQRHELRRLLCHLRHKCGAAERKCLEKMDENALLCEWRLTTERLEAIVLGRRELYAQVIDQLGMTLEDRDVLLYRDAHLSLLFSSPLEQQEGSPRTLSRQLPLESSLSSSACPPSCAFPFWLPSVEHPRAWSPRTTSAPPFSSSSFSAVPFAPSFASESSASSCACPASSASRASSAASPRRSPPPVGPPRPAVCTAAASRSPLSAESFERRKLLAYLGPVTFSSPFQPQTQTREPAAKGGRPEWARAGSGARHRPPAAPQTIDHSLRLRALRLPVETAEQVLAPPEPTQHAFAPVALQASRPCGRGSPLLQVYLHRADGGVEETNAFPSERGEPAKPSAAQATTALRVDAGSAPAGRAISPERARLGDSADPANLCREERPSDPGDSDAESARRNLSLVAFSQALRELERDAEEDSCVRPLDLRAHWEKRERAERRNGGTTASCLSRLSTERETELLQAARRWAEKSRNLLAGRVERYDRMVHRVQICKRILDAWKCAPATLDEALAGLLARYAPSPLFHFDPLLAHAPMPPQTSGFRGADEDRTWNEERESDAESSEPGKSEAEDAEGEEVEEAESEDAEEEEERSQGRGARRRVDSPGKGKGRERSLQEKERQRGCGGETGGACGPPHRGAGAEASPQAQKTASPAAAGVPRQQAPAGGAAALRGARGGREMGRGRGDDGESRPADEYPSAETQKEGERNTPDRGAETAFRGDRAGQTVAARPEKQEAEQAASHKRREAAAHEELEEESGLLVTREGMCEGAAGERGASSRFALNEGRGDEGSIQSPEGGAETCRRLGRGHACDSGLASIFAKEPVCFRTSSSAVSLASCCFHPPRCFASACMGDTGGFEVVVPQTQPAKSRHDLAAFSSSFRDAVEAADCAREDARLQGAGKADPTREKAPERRVESAAGAGDDPPRNAPEDTAYDRQDARALDVVEAEEEERPAQRGDKGRVLRVKPHRNDAGEALPVSAYASPEKRRRLLPSCLHEPQTTTSLFLRSSVLRGAAPARRREAAAAPLPHETKAQAAASEEAGAQSERGGRERKKLSDRVRWKEGRWQGHGGAEARRDRDCAEVALHLRASREAGGTKEGAEPRAQRHSEGEVNAQHGTFGAGSAKSPQNKNDGAGRQEGTSESAGAAHGGMPTQGQGGAEEMQKRRRGETEDPAPRRASPGRPATRGLGTLTETSGGSEMRTGEETESRRARGSQAASSSASREKSAGGEAGDTGSCVSGSAIRSRGSSSRPRSVVPPLFPEDESLSFGVSEPWIHASGPSQSPSGPLRPWGDSGAAPVCANQLPPAASSPLAAPGEAAGDPRASRTFQPRASPLAPSPAPVWAAVGAEGHAEAQRSARKADTKETHAPDASAVGRGDRLGAAAGPGPVGTRRAAAGEAPQEAGAGARRAEEAGGGCSGAEGASVSRRKEDKAAQQREEKAARRGSEGVEGDPRREGGNGRGQASQCPRRSTQLSGDSAPGDAGATREADAGGGEATERGKQGSAPEANETDLPLRAECREYGRGAEERMREQLASKTTEERRQPDPRSAEEPDAPGASRNGARVVAATGEKEGIGQKTEDRRGEAGRLTPSGSPESAEASLRNGDEAARGDKRHPKAPESTGAGASSADQAAPRRGTASGPEPPLPRGEGLSAAGARRHSWQGTRLSQQETPCERSVGTDSRDALRRRVKKKKVKTRKEQRDRAT
ncbi:hypothetical protein BESB_071280 [Besnoitia besnoiti]|uniref:Uncharacterized protein n=1 Tax=Besnoitia besnoiti TaxID=94643 RepID=A0A2A9MDE5_BESBE|nr:uncharacterized protein BESB_071280 [Besnoitia besnoiti]PFH33976.1 hypothetical protein BESB_071280 [Besnoitia besnoiti]